MLRETVAFDARELRTTGVVMLGAALALPVLPGHPGVACPLRSLTGVPCPLCGMTTSVEEGVRGHLGRAFAANPGGLLALAAALILLVWRPAQVRVPAAIPIFAVAAAWLFELHRFSFI